MQQALSLHPEDLGNGIFCQKIHDGQIVIFTLSSMSREAVDTWASAQLRVLKEWPADRPVCIMGDQSSMSHIAFSPYMKSHFADFASFSKGRTVRLAIVVGKSFFAQLVTLLARGIPKGALEVRCFSERDKGIAWLEEFIETKSLEMPV